MSVSSVPAEYDFPIGISGAAEGHVQAEEDLARMFLEEMYLLKMVKPHCVRSRGKGNSKFH